MQLKPDECRVLGVLVEKAMTTPGQYPLSLNGLTVGCNQKNNRFPVVEWDEERVYDAVDGLRAKKLLSEVQLTGSRVPKFKHNAREALGVDTSQLVVLTELMLRGPQSIGDLRGNASRMHPLESMEAAKAVLDSLMSPARPEALVKEIPPPPGGRARLWVQLLCPDLHPLSSLAPSTMGGMGAQQHSEAHSLAARVEDLEHQVAKLRAGLSSLAAKLGEPDPLG
jgi:uncharacterized protein YceH (UPF0502 family)